MSTKPGSLHLAGVLAPLQGWVYLYADLSDLAKPYARTLEALDWVRDGSDPAPKGEKKRVVPGYWLNEVYVLLEPGRVLPVVFEPFSLRSGEALSQTEVLLRGMEEAFQLAGPRGVWVADRGYDDGNLFDALLSRSDRDLRRVGDLGWVKVRLPDHPDRVLTLIVARSRGRDEPLALLTTLPVPDAAAARRAVAAYLRRWGAAEDPVRFLKQTFRLEKFLVASLRALRVWVFLIGVAMAFHSLLLGPRSPGRRLAGTVESFRDNVDFLGYRLARALAALLQRLPVLLYRRLVLASGP